MSGTEASGSVTPAPPPAEIGWLRALATGIAILVVGFGGAVYGANRILTKALGLRRTPREWLAVGLFFLVVIALAWVLRRLQDRKLI
jgi:divalent metal cation (Fe/Co/Zn/Cd) transporter